MATTTYSLTNTWSSSARYTSSGSNDVRVSNPNDNVAIFFTLTNSDSAPSTDPAGSNKLLPGDKETIALSDGDRLWVSGQTGFAALEV